MLSNLLTHLRQNPREVLVLVFTLAYLAVASAAAWARGNQEFVLYVGLMLVCLASVMTLHLRVGLSSGALWGLSIWGLAHMSGGLVHVPESWPSEGERHVLYNAWLIPGLLKYDQIVHAFGFGITTWVCWQSLQVASQDGVDGQVAKQRKHTIEPTFGRLLLCWAAGQGFGGLNEVLEFIITLLVPETNVGGYVNTGWDLVANLCGATVAVTLIAISNRGERPKG